MLERKAGEGQQRSRNLVQRSESKTQWNKTMVQPKVGSCSDVGTQYGGTVMDPEDEGFLEER